MRISAIIPAFNAEPWLAEAVGSVLAQTMPVAEIIVVNDGSADRTGEIARSLGCRVVDLPVNSGEGIARNEGVRCATGDAIAWLDADDWWAPRHVEILAGLLDRYPEASVACAAVERVGLRTGVNFGYAPVDAPANIFWQAVRDWVHPIIGALVRRQALIDIGGFSTIHGPSVDYDMWLRLSRDHLFIATREVTSYWRWHARQQSRNYGAQLAAVYSYRRAFLDDRLRPGFPEDARRFEDVVRYLWKRDFDAALKRGDLADCEAILAVAGTVPGLGAADVETRRAAVPGRARELAGGPA